MLCQAARLSIAGRPNPQELRPTLRTLRALHDQFRVLGGILQRPLALAVYCQINKAQGNRGWILCYVLDHAFRITKKMIELDRKKDT